MKVICFINKYNGIVKKGEKFSRNVLIASFDINAEYANFVPSIFIDNSSSGAEFIKNICNKEKPDLVIFNDEALIKESASVFAGREELGLISHSNMLYEKEGKVVGVVPGWENLSAEVYSLTKPILVILKDEENVSLEKRNRKIIQIDRNTSLKLIRVEEEGKNPLKNAKIIVGIGRGVKKDILPEIEEFADNIGAEIGCTRPVADIGIVPSFRMIGDSGISVNPEIYIAFGISGAIQHLSAVNAKYIIAVNTDANAPIFEKATLALNVSVEKTITEIKQWIKNSSR